MTGEQLAARREYHRKYYSRPEQKARAKAYIEKIRSDPERAAKLRERMRLSMRRWQAKPENREKSRLRSAAYKSIPANRERAKLVRLSPWNIRSSNEKARKFRTTPRGRFAMYKGGAALRSLPFNLSFDEFMSFWKKPCHYCGDSIEYVGIDRVDSATGYVTSNLVSCCTPCNRMKLAMDVISFITHCRKIVARAQEAICP